jgi:hypothetical protein
LLKDTEKQMVTQSVMFSSAEVVLCKLLYFSHLRTGIVGTTLKSGASWPNG